MVWPRIIGKFDAKRRKNVSCNHRRVRKSDGKSLVATTARENRSVRQRGREMRRDGVCGGGCEGRGREIVTGEEAEALPANGNCRCSTAIFRVEKLLGFFASVSRRGRPVVVIRPGFEKRSGELIVARSFSLNAVPSVESPAFGDKMLKVPSRAKATQCAGGDQQAVDEAIRGFLEGQHQGCGPSRSVDQGSQERKLGRDTRRLPADAQKKPPDSCAPAQPCAPGDRQQREADSQAIGKPQPRTSAWRVGRWDHG